MAQLMTRQENQAMVADTSVLHLCARITDARPAFSAELYSAANSRAICQMDAYTSYVSLPSTHDASKEPGHAQFVFATTGPDDQQWRDPTIRQPRTIDASHGHAALRSKRVSGSDGPHAEELTAIGHRLGSIVSTCV